MLPKYSTVLLDYVLQLPIGIKPIYIYIYIYHMLPKYITSRLDNVLHVPIRYMNRCYEHDYVASLF